MSLEQKRRLWAIISLCVGGCNTSSSYGQSIEFCFFLGPILIREHFAGLRPPERVSYSRPVFATSRIVLTCPGRDSPPPPASDPIKTRDGSSENDRSRERTVPWS